MKCTTLFTLAWTASLQHLTAAAEYANLALGKPTWQSSVHQDWTSGRAVDGDKATTYLSNTCMHTVKDPSAHPWWTVDLGQRYDIYGVNVTTRSDCCDACTYPSNPCPTGFTCAVNLQTVPFYTCECPEGSNCELPAAETTVAPEVTTASTTEDCLGERLNNFFVGLTNVQPTIATPPTVDNIVKCGQWPGVAPMGETLFVECASGLSPARYVVILPPLYILTLCEVEVYGTLPAEPSKNIPTTSKTAMKKCNLSALRKRLSHKTAKAACVMWLCKHSSSYRAAHGRRCRKGRFHSKRG